MYNRKFSHIYVEEDAFTFGITETILKKFPGSNVMEIKHYKDIFCRKHQDFRAQKCSQSLILAVNREKSVYKGARVCQDFGNEHFYYCSNVKNCIFDCEYCYLQGMYSSGNIVIFVDLDKIFKETDELLRKHSVYLCISYDTDLPALEGITGFLEKWAHFASSYNNLTIEVRTKSGSIINSKSQINNLIFAWTMSPEHIIDAHESGTASLEARIKAVNNVVDAGGRVHLCFDPIIYCDNFEAIYGEMFDMVFKNVDITKVEGVSVGTFRISKSYLKNMRKQRLCEITAFPYKCIDGVYQYDTSMNSMILNFALRRIREYFDDLKIFIN